MHKKLSGSGNQTCLNLKLIFLFSIQNEDLKIKGKNDLQSSSKVSEEEEGDYETVSSSTLEAIHALKILPAKPLQESEYAGNSCCLQEVRQTWR